MFTASALFTNAQQTALIKGEHNPSILTTCLPMVLLISVIIAGAVYFLSINNKGKGINDKNNSGKNS
jgi:hypothetical protein